MWNKAASAENWESEEVSAGVGAYRVSIMDVAKIGFNVIVIWTSDFGIHGAVPIRVLSCLD